MFAKWNQHTLYFGKLNVKYVKSSFYTQTQQTDENKLSNTLISNEQSLI